MANRTYKDLIRDLTEQRLDSNKGLELNLVEAKIEVLASYCQQNVDFDNVWGLKDLKPHHIETISLINGLRQVVSSYYFNSMKTVDEVSFDDIKTALTNSFNRCVNDIYKTDLGFDIGPSFLGIYENWERYLINIGSEILTKKLINIPLTL